jgi:alpha-D-ribose 1-methylphosphonate 5-triphosphate synthase subunit PhnH
MNAHAPLGLDLTDLQPGLQSPAQQSQQVFRRLLDAVARPGSIQALPHDVLAQLTEVARLTHADDPDPAGAAMRAVLLTLLDGDTSLHVGAGLAPGRLAAYLQFHSGVTLIDSPAQAEFTAITAAHASTALLANLPWGSDEAPQGAATLVLRVPDMGATQRDDGRFCRLILRGPGVIGSIELTVAGVPAEFWRSRQAMTGDYPRGVDLLLVTDRSVAAIPRSTWVEPMIELPGSAGEH